MSTSRPRIAITGMGVRSPAGNELAEVWQTMLAGRTRAATVEELVVNGAPVTFGCLVPPFDLARYLSAREQQQMERAAHLAIAAASDAVAAAGIAVPAGRDADDALPAERLGVSVGTGVAGMEAVLTAISARLVDSAPYPAFTMPKAMSNAIAARIAMALRAQGPSLTYATACASGATAIGEAAGQICTGRVDAVIAGGVDAPVIDPIVRAFHALRALSTRCDEPEAAPRPFDAQRDGFVLGEAAAFLVLERLEHAAARGAPIHGELIGYASNSDAYHIVAPAADGQIAAQCIRAALRDAALRAEDIGHVNAHGTSTVRNDDAEAKAIIACFGDDCPPVTAPKGVVGHSLGGAGAFEAVVALLSATRGLVPPVANFSTDCAPEEIDVVRDEPRRIRVGPVLSNSFGFGGHNSCLVLCPH